MNGVGESPIGYALNSYYRSNVFILADSVSWVKGKHTLKFGGEGWRRRDWRQIARCVRNMQHSILIADL